MKLNIVTVSESEKVSKVINEMIINVDSRDGKSVTFRDEHSIVYGRLKQRLQNDIIKFCLNEIELRNDLMFFRSMVGDVLNEREIIKHVENIQDKYNNGRVLNKKIGVDYFLESTRYDFVLVLFITVIRGENVFQTRFVFRFRKGSLTDGVYDQDMSGLPK